MLEQQLRAAEAQVTRVTQELEKYEQIRRQVEMKVLSLEKELTLHRNIVLKLQLQLMSNANQNVPASTPPRQIIKSDQVEDVDDDDLAIISVDYNKVNNSKDNASSYQNINSTSINTLDSMSSMLQNQMSTSSTDTSYQSFSMDQSMSASSQVTMCPESKSALLFPVQYCCKNCGNQFQSSNDLRLHINQMIPLGKPHSCQLCCAVFESSEAINEHINALHSDFQCHLCSEKFKAKTGLRIHMLRHTGDKPYACPYCGKVFRHNSGLSRHKKRYCKRKFGGIYFTHESQKNELLQEDSIMSESYLITDGLHGKHDLE